MALKILLSLSWMINKAFFYNRVESTYRLPKKCGNCVVCTTACNPLADRLCAGSNHGISQPSMKEKRLSEKFIYQGTIPVWSKIGRIESECSALKSTNWTDKLRRTNEQESEIATVGYVWVASGRTLFLFQMCKQSFGQKCTYTGSPTYLRIWINIQRLLW